VPAEIPAENCLNMTRSRCNGWQNRKKKRRLLTTVGAERERMGLSPGTRFGNYEITGTLGAGGAQVAVVRRTDARVLSNDVFDKESRRRSIRQGGTYD
jgi:hypothetical protein